jgi:hypothetical protein
MIEELLTRKSASSFFLLRCTFQFYTVLIYKQTCRRCDRNSDPGDACGSTERPHEASKTSTYRIHNEFYGAEALRGQCQSAGRSNFSWNATASHGFHKSAPLGWTQTQLNPVNVPSSIMQFLVIVIFILIRFPSSLQEEGREFRSRCTLSKETLKITHNPSPLLAILAKLSNDLPQSQGNFWTVTSVSQPPT